MGARRTEERTPEAISPADPVPMWQVQRASEPR